MARGAHPITVQMVKFHAERNLGPYKPTCECCGRELDLNTMTWLELNAQTLEYARPGTAPWSDGPASQGSFPYGQACARRILRDQAKGRQAED
jgi:hypothetical protein